MDTNTNTHTHTQPLMVTMEKLRVGELLQIRAEITHTHTLTHSLTHSHTAPVCTS